MFRYVNPDYFRLVPWQSDGLKPVGYGYDSVEGEPAFGHQRSTPPATISRHVR